MAGEERPLVAAEEAMDGGMEPENEPTRERAEVLRRGRAGEGAASSISLLALFGDARGPRVRCRLCLWLRT